MRADFARALMPRFDFAETHRLHGLRAGADDLLAAVRGYDDRHDRVLRMLLQLREGPGRLLGHLLPGRGIPASRPRFGLASFIVLAEDGRGIAYGLAGRFWQIDYGLMPVRDAAAFASLAAPRCAKLLLSFEVRESAPGVCMLETTTRVQCTDDDALRRMRLYWLMVRPFSGWIRRRILARVSRASAGAKAPARRRA